MSESERPPESEPEAAPESPSEPAAESAPEPSPPAPAAEPAPASESPQPVPAAEPESGPSPLVLWFKRQPLFAVILVTLAIGSPFAVMSLKTRVLRTQLTVGLGEWHDALSTAGLPVPWLGRARVLPPSRLSGVTREEYASVELEQHYLTLAAWSALLDGTQPAELPVSEGWGAAVRACASYRTAAAQAKPPEATLVTARTESSRAASSLIPTLDLIGDLLDEKYERVISLARSQREGSPKACRTALDALSAEATRRQVRGVILRRPPSTPHLRSLLDLELADALPPAMDEAGPGLAELLTLGAPDTERAEVVLALLARRYPEGFSENDPFVEVWSIMQGALGDLLRTRFSSWEQDPASAARVLDLAARLDPGAELTPPDTFTQWRSRLNEVVDQPTELLRFAERLLELGLAPSGLEEMLASHFVEVGGTRRPEAEVPERIGRILADAYLLSESLAEATDEAKSQAITDVANRAVQIEELLNGRSDPLAQRMRGQLAMAKAKVMVRCQRWPEAEEATNQAKELGYEPGFRLLDLRVAIRLAGGGDGALDVARTAASVLDQHAQAVGRTQQPEAHLAWELAGYPVQTVLLNGLRGRAKLRLAQLLLDAGATDEASKACQEALALDSRNARVHLTLAKIYAKQGRTKEARKVVFDGLRGLSQARNQDEVRRELRELLKELGPN